MSVTILSTTILSVIITSDNVNWVQFNRGTEICSVRLRPDKAGAILVLIVDLYFSSDIHPLVFHSTINDSYR